MLRCWETIPHIVSMTNILFMRRTCVVCNYIIHLHVCTCMLSFANFLDINIYIYISRFSLSVSSVCLFLHAVCVHISESQCVFMRWAICSLSGLVLTPRALSFF